MTQLSKNFTLEELTKTSHPVDNTPTVIHLDNLRILCEKVLQPIRDKFGPVTVSSGYRSKALNTLVGGSTTSDHCSGRAADIEVMGVNNLLLASWIRDNLKFKQLILEFYDRDSTNSGWVHVSYDALNLKQEVLRAEKVSGKTVYYPGLV